MTSSSTSDLIYVNIKSVVEGQQTFDFSANRVEPILQNPSDYELSVVRFSVPSSGIPVKIWNNEEYKITLKFNATTLEYPLLLIQNSNEPPLYENYSIYSYQEFIAIFNKTLKDLHDAMVLAEPTFAPTKECAVSLSPDTNLITFYAQTLYGAPSVELSFNFSLASQTLFDFVKLDTDLFKLKIQSTGINNISWGGLFGYTMIQQSNTLASISDLDKIIFETSSIPVNPELLGTGSNNETRQVITDFNASNFTRDNLPIQFFPMGPLRFYTLNSSYPLSKLDLIVSWEDKKGKVRPIFLDVNNPITVKLLFQKKGSKILDKAYKM